MELEAGKDKNPNRIIDNLDDLDKEFCTTLDKLIAVYKRIIIRAYAEKESKGGEVR